MQPSTLLQAEFLLKETTAKHAENTFRARLEEVVFLFVPKTSEGIFSWRSSVKVRAIRAPPGTSL